MVERRRSGMAFGLLLVLVGVWFLAVQLLPGLQTWLALYASWPLVVVGVGVLFLLFGIFAGVPGMAVPASIIGGVGLLLYWQNATENWASWAYAWTLVPGFIGVGVVLTGLLGENRRESIIGGLWLVITSAVLFVVFAAFLGGQTVFGQLWPFLFIAFGVLLLVRAFWRGR